MKLLRKIGQVLGMGLIAHSIYFIMALSVVLIMFNHGLTNYTGEQYLILASGFALNVLIVFLPFGLISVVLESDTYRNIIKLGKGGSARWVFMLLKTQYDLLQESPDLFGANFTQI